MLDKDTFVCVDCETTGLESDTDRIIEVAAARFTLGGVMETFETLIDPEREIPEETQKIHHISNEMVQGKPKIQEVLHSLLAFIGKDVLVGHGIRLDIDFIAAAAKRHAVPCSLHTHPFIDTLRLARLYGESPKNSLETLRKHFNIAEEGAHRAMSDVIVNIEVFKFLASHYKTTAQIFERLKHPILLKAMPLGKHKGRPFSDIPVEYLRWALSKDFDQDLVFSIRTELKKRQKGDRFQQSSNPFSEL